MTDVRHPEIEVKLIGGDGNAFSILGKVTKALRRAGVEPDEIDLFIEECTSGDYNKLLQVVMTWVTVK